MLVVVMVVTVVQGAEMSGDTSPTLSKSLSEDMGPPLRLSSLAPFLIPDSRRGSEKKKGGLEQWNQQTSGEWKRKKMDSSLSDRLSNPNKIR